MKTTFNLALRDLLRNPRRSFFSAFALAGGLALMMIMAAITEGDVRDSMSLNIQLQSGHFQIQAKDYSLDKTSLTWSNLVEDPDAISAKLAALPEVKAATPRLYASGMVVTPEKTYSVRVTGIEPDSAANDPYRQGLVAGEFLTAGDRDSVLLGQPLADKLGITAGGTITLMVNTSNGEVSQQNFNVKGIYNTRTPAHDKLTVFMPLEKAQAITQTAGHASTIFVLLNDREQTAAVTSALQSDRYKIITWIDASKMVFELQKMTSSYMGILYFIVLGITATIIVNTLVMSVFERTREIGILSAIGFKSRQITVMFLIESAMLAVLGVILGLVLGGLLVLYSNKVGFYIGDFGLSGMLLRERLYGYMTVRNTVNLSLLAFFITIIASLYPATMAARMQAVEALRGGK